MKEQEYIRCRRCNKPAQADLICQSCKNELLANFEASSDWQTAFEIERAQMLASRYQLDENDNSNNYGY
jgi:hypothetical protein